MLDFAQVRRELLRAVRGKRSQELVNRRFLFRFNQMHRWESGRTKITWADFVRLCAICKIPLADALTRVLGFFEEPSRTDQLVRWLVRLAPPTYVTKVTGLSRAVIEHWSAGRSSPSLDDILLLVHRIPCAIVELVSALVNIDEIPSLAEEVRARRDRANLLEEEPRVEALLAALETDTYQQAAEGAAATKFLARSSGLSEKRVRDLLDRLEKLGVITRTKPARAHQKKYVIAEAWLRTFDVRRDFRVIQRVKAHWLNEASHRLSAAKELSPEESFSYFVFSASDEVLRAVQEAYLDLLKRVVAQVETQTSPRTKTRVLSIQLFAPTFDGK